ncbi:hypothetical protein MB27_27980 [Actinoplanes utahensis]|uniref:Uncharacterized protein n=1 Tax=Actinoplanes utahensis TaxID=1869 RepID=A0A0A6UGG8_ACTUT|nr:hypothetical protein MB27_27980 [Actinoplanes utahensis]
MSKRRLPAEPDVVLQPSAGEFDEFSRDGVGQVVDDCLSFIFAGNTSLPAERALKEKVDLTLQLIPQVSNGLKVFVSVGPALC